MMVEGRGRGRGRRGGGGGGGFGLGFMLLLLLGVTWFASPQVAGLQCYECDGGGRCDGEKYKQDQQSIETCKESTDVCMVLNYEDVPDSKGWIRRRCMKKEITDNYVAPCGVDKDKHDRKFNYCFCKEDLCNVGDGTSLGSGNGHVSGSGDSSGSSSNNNGTIKKYPSNVMISMIAAVTVIGTKFGMLHGRI